MSQKWINNIPEVDWHGANGSIQISGDPAASRYTEARLSKFSEEGLLYNIKKNNVLMKLNFSEDEEWPEVFPALVPRLMINGCQGIGSTIANHWTLYNLKELYEVIDTYIKTDQLNFEELYPDYPTGGIIINKKDLSTIHKTGKGKVVLRGKAEVKDNKILITEIPYQVYVEPLIEQIKKCIENDIISGINNIYNKSDKKRLLIEIECDSNPEYILNQLYKNTNLQKVYNPNQFALIGKTPKLLTLKEYLDVYIQHNYTCIVKENEYDLDKAKSRLEIVEGLVKALEDIDNIIQLIKNSESSKNAVDNLISKYDFTVNQANAIVNMKLGKLARLEKVELNKEKEELISTIETCEEIIKNKEKQKDIFLTRLKNFVDKYGEDRKTEVIQVEPLPKEEKEIQNVEPEKCAVIMTESGLIKRIPLTSFRTQNRNTKGIKTNDDVVKTIIRTNTVDNLMIFTNKGKVYRLLVDSIPVGTNKSKGVSISNLVSFEKDEKASTIYSIYRDVDFKYVVFISKNGMIKKSSLEEYFKTRKKTGTNALKIKEDDELVNVFLANDEDVIIATKNGKSIRFKLTDISPSGKTAYGVKSISLDDNDCVVAGIPIRNKDDDLAVFSVSGLAKRIPLNIFPVQKRAGKGVICYKGEVADIVSVCDEDKILICGDKAGICILASDIPVLTSKTGLGNIIIKDNVIREVSKV